MHGRWLFFLTCIFILFGGGLAQAQLVPRPSPVLPNFPSNVLAWLNADYGQLLVSASQLESRMTDNQRDCSRVPETNTLLAAQCAREHDIIALQWDAYARQRAAHEHKRHIAILWGQEDAALQGASSTAVAFADRAAALGLGTVRDNMSVVMTAIVGLVARPLAASGGAAAGIVALALTFEAKYPDCGFNDLDLRTSCKNFKVFVATLDRVSQQEVQQGGLEVLREFCAWQGTSSCRAH